MKTCTKCSKEKPINEFSTYKKRNGTHGYRGQCKSCDSKYKNEHYVRNKAVYIQRSKNQRLSDPEKAREYDRAYHKKHREKRNAQARAYSKTPEGRKASSRAYNKYRATEDGRYKERARNKLNKAVQSGKITKPTKCSLCGTRAEVEGHHEDYNKPLDVVWLCKECHENTHHLNEGHKSI